jgi:pimeloyl-ACP methyl ester carboxylesterase
VLLVRGERGFLSPEDADELRRRVPQAEVVNVAAGHNVQEDEPVLLAEIVNRFLAGTR